MKNEKAAVLTDIIRTRRSVFPAQYTDREISDDIINEMLENANWAPSHKITQPWRFKVLKNEAKSRLGDFMAEKYKEEFVGDQFLEKKYQKLKSKPRKAAAIILICMQKDEENRVPEWEELAALAAAVQNMWLTCHAHKIGSYWSTPFTIKHMSEFIPLNEGESCKGIFYMGHYEKAPPQSKRTGVQQKVEWITE